MTSRSSANYPGSRQLNDLSAYLAEVARGNVPGAEELGGCGQVALASAPTDWDIWPLAATALIPSVLDAAVEMTISSTSGEDSVGGSGIQSLRVVYLDADGAETSFEGALPLSVSARFIQCMHSTDGTAAAGNISATAGGVTYSYIPAGDVRCRSSGRAVPAGKQLFITEAEFGSISGTGAAKSTGELVADSILHTRYPGIFLPHRLFTAQDGGMPLRFSPPMRFPALSVVKFHGTSDKACTLSGSWGGWYENV